MGKTSTTKQQPKTKPAWKQHLAYLTTKDYGKEAK